MANMKNQNVSGYPLPGSENVFIGYGKHQLNVGVSENKPPIPLGINNMTAHQNVLKMFDNNVNQMIHVQQPHLQTIQGREIMIGGQRHAGPGITSQIQTQGSYITINGTPNPVNGGSEYSSPRSSVGSAGDSKNSSPRSSLIQQMPPPPYDPRFRNSISSNLSSISLDSNRSSSSPRTSLAGGIIYDRFPSPRNSIVIPQDGGNMNTTHGSLTNRSRFNEHAPFQNYIVRPPVINGQIMLNQVTGATVHVHHIPVTQNGNVQAMVANTTHLRSRNNMSQISPPPAIPARVPKNQPGIPQSQSESEIAALTKKLEQDLLCSMSPSSSPLPREPPPPYHGPHKTEPMPGLPPRNTTPNAVSRTSNAQIQMVGGNIQSSSSVHPSVVSKLQYQVTPPKPKGPTEAEIKLNALTQQLEDEMESSAQGEYFGEYLLES